jgi:hypothetical protein
VGEDKDPAPKLRAKHAEVEGAVELLTRGEVSKATNSILISATISLYLAFNVYVHSLSLFSSLCSQDKLVIRWIRHCKSSVAIQRNPLTILIVCKLSLHRNWYLNDKYIDILVILASKNVNDTRE